MPVQKSQVMIGLERLRIAGPLVRNCYARWLDQKYKLYRDHLKNPASTRRFETSSLSLTEMQSDLVEEIDRNGFATIGFADLIDDLTFQEKISAYVNDFAESDLVAERGAKFALNHEPTNAKDHVSLARHFVEDQVISADDPMLLLGVHPALLNVVNTYLGLWSKLKKVHLWYSFPSPSERARTGAQNWHRDPEDERMLTVFLYFTDVDQTSGALEYIPSTRFGGERHETWPDYGGCAKPTSRPSSEQVDDMTSPGERISIACKALTFLFCDTTGFHRGGYALTKPRIVAHWTYATPASLWPRRYRLDRAVSLLDVVPEARYALS